MNKIYMLLIGLVLFSCKTPDIQPEMYEKSRIVLGEGGGFTGFVSKRCILDNGMLYNKMHQDTGFIYAEKIKINSAMQLINNFTVLGLDKIESSKPGNTYRFIEFYKDGQEHSVTWDPYDGQDRTSINSYYNLLMQLFTKKNK